MSNIDEFEVLLGHDEISEDESEGDLVDLSGDDLDADLEPGDFEQSLFDELLED